MFQWKIAALEILTCLGALYSESDLVSSSSSLWRWWKKIQPSLHFSIKKVKSTKMNDVIIQTSNAVYSFLIIGACFAGQPPYWVQSGALLHKGWGTLFNYTGKPLVVSSTAPPLLKQLLTLDPGLHPLWWTDACGGLLWRQYQGGGGEEPWLQGN